MVTRILDPTIRTGAPAAATAPLAPRPPQLAGATLGLLANGKSNGMVLLDRLAEILRERHGVAGVVRVAKTNASVPVTDEQAEPLVKGCAAVVTAIGDWGSCSSGSVLDAIFFEKHGIPAAVVITEPFVPTAHGIAEMAGMPDYPHAVIPHPVGSLAAAEVRARADAIADRVAALLVGTVAVAR